MIFLINGFFYYLLDGVFRYKFRFDEIFYPLWVWTIYPILGALFLGLGIVAGVLAVIGIHLPLPKGGSQPPEEQIPNSTAEELIPEIDKALRSGKIQLTTEENEVYNKLKEFVNSRLKVKDIFSVQELKILIFLIIVKIYGLKIRRRL